MVHTTGEEVGVWEKDAEKPNTVQIINALGYIKSETEK